MTLCLPGGVALAANRPGCGDTPDAAETYLFRARQAQSSGDHAAAVDVLWKAWCKTGDLRHLVEICEEQVELQDLSKAAEIIRYAERRLARGGSSADVAQSLETCKRKLQPPAVAPPPAQVIAAPPPPPAQVIAAPPSPPPPQQQQQEVVNTLAAQPGTLPHSRASTALIISGAILVPVGLALVAGGALGCGASSDFSSCGTGVGLMAGAAVAEVVGVPLLIVGIIRRTRESTVRANLVPSFQMAPRGSGGGLAFSLSL